MNEPSNLAKNLSKSFAKLHCRVTDIEVSINNILDRLYQLEEKERERAREDYNREIQLDEIELARIEGAE